MKTIEGPPYAEPMQQFKPEGWTNKHDYINKRRNDNDQEGRKAWIDYVSKTWSQVKMNMKIDQILASAGFRIHDILKMNDTRALPELSEAQMYRYNDALTEELFGMEAFREDGRIEQGVLKFIEPIMTHIWAQYCKMTKRLVDKIPAQTKVLDAQWEVISRDNAKPDYQLDILTGLGHTTAGGDAAKLPRALRIVLAQLASAGRVQALTDELQRLVADLHVTEEDIRQNNLGPAISTIDWETGTEELDGLNKDAIWEKLGLKEKLLPLFNKMEDTTGLTDAWTEEGRKAMSDAERARPLQP
ncbi:uncharacterized protein FIBRA_08658 [Fibroporia radiculosa]|uniref:Uncharacterized protein n=1 Tax=Fibroporia radiculosa TaxID=599839 RepID=J4H5A5_9APHY|nr:uncharacterized protein FIBRA_08658 [Fibroporia radiculosa]CCM06399.1 predicted protein [Fibroporia radiculosa]